jgi:hypothetical protein
MLLPRRGKHNKKTLKDQSIPLIQIEIKWKKHSRLFYWSIFIFVGVYFVGRKSVWQIRLIKNIIPSSSRRQGLAFMS